MRLETLVVCLIMSYGHVNGARPASGLGATARIPNLVDMTLEVL